MAWKGSHHTAEAKALIRLANKERQEEEGWVPFQKLGGWSDAEKDEERMRRWREEL